MAAHRRNVCNRLGLVTESLQSAPASLCLPASTGRQSSTKQQQALAHASKWASAGCCAGSKLGSNDISHRLGCAGPDQAPCRVMRRGMDRQPAYLNPPPLRSSCSQASRSVRPSGQLSVFGAYSMSPKSSWNGPNPSMTSPQDMWLLSCGWQERSTHCKPSIVGMPMQAKGRNA